MDYGHYVARLARLDSDEAGEALIADYAAALAEHLHADPVKVAKGDLGWLLGELTLMQRRQALSHLPEDVEHPILGRSLVPMPFMEMIWRGVSLFGCFHHPLDHDHEKDV